MMTPTVNSSTPSITLIWSFSSKQVKILREVRHKVIFLFSCSLHCIILFSDLDRWRFFREQLISFCSVSFTIMNGCSSRLYLTSPLFVCFFHSFFLSFFLSVKKSNVLGKVKNIWCIAIIKSILFSLCLSTNKLENNIYQIRICSKDFFFLYHSNILTLIPFFSFYFIVMSRHVQVAYRTNL